MGGGAKKKKHNTALHPSKTQAVADTEGDNVLL